MGEIKYPNGRSYTPPVKAPALGNRKNHSFANRGQSFEDEINQSNQIYMLDQIACIHKKPTPIQIVHVEYPHRTKAVIKEAYFRQASTTDYNGVYKGIYIDFEAKETKNKTQFPLQNIHEHQIIHIKNVLKCNGVAFLLVKFQIANTIYLLDGIKVIEFWDRKVNGGRKSISLEEFENFGHVVPSSYQIPVNYLSIVDKLYLKKLSNER